MKIEKIKNYNQKLLAILGTVSLIFLIVGLIAFVSITVLELRRYSNDDIETGILSDEKIEELQKENKRKQVISFEMPKLIDTLNSVYIIPVSHKNLNEAEDIDETLNAFASAESPKSADRRYSKRFYGAFNNLIVYNQISGSKKKLFDKRVNFNNVKAEYFQDDVLLLFKASEKDTYKDGVINLLDFKSLYVYSINSKTLKKIGGDEMDVFSYKFLNNSKDLVIGFGIDKNKDGKFEDFKEPTMLKKYSYQTEKLTDIIENQTSSDLQKLLEGTNN